MSILWWTSSSFVASVVEGKRLVIVSSAGMLFKYADASDKSLLCKSFRSKNRFSHVSCLLINIELTSRWSYKCGLASTIPAPKNAATQKLINCMNRILFLSRQGKDI